MTPERTQRLEAVLSKRQNDITVILENVFDPRNVSAIMRSCDAVGIQELYVLNTILPPHNNWGYRSGRSAEKWLTVHQFENLDTCLAAVRQKYDVVLTTYLSTDAVSLYSLDLTGRLALVFGNEQNGITEELRHKGDGNFVIPQVGMIQSLNISVACAVTMYEAFRQKEMKGHYNQPKLSAFEAEAIGKQWGLYD